MRNNPLLLEDTADAIAKIQRHGYTFTFDINSEKYQVCEDPEATKVLHEFDNWEQIIAYANNLFIEGVPGRIGK